MFPIASDGDIKSNIGGNQMANFAIGFVAAIIYPFNLQRVFSVGTYHLMRLRNVLDQSSPQATQV